MDYNETWLPANGFEDYLEVSNLGGVRRKKRRWIQGRHEVIPGVTKQIKPVNNGGYMSVGVWLSEGKAKNLMLARLIADTFIPFEGSDRLTVKHRNRVRADLRAENLYWYIPKHSR